MVLSIQMCLVGTAAATADLAAEPIWVAVPEAAASAAVVVVVDDDAAAAAAAAAVAVAAAAAIAAAAGVAAAAAAAAGALLREVLLPGWHISDSGSDSHSCDSPGGDEASPSYQSLAPPRQDTQGQFTEAQRMMKCHWDGWEYECGEECQDKFTTAELKLCLSVLQPYLPLPMIDWWCADKRYEHTHWTVGDLAFDVARQAKVKRANPTAGGKVFNLKAKWQLHNTGKECCQSMQCKAYDFKETMWKKAKAAVRANEDCYPRKMDVCVKEKHRLEECRAWWKGHVKVFGCDMPELGHISINNIPWTDLYENYYCVECYDDTAASRTTWDTARHVEFGSSLVRRKKKRGLSKCNT